MALALLCESGMHHRHAREYCCWKEKSERRTELHMNQSGIFVCLSWTNVRDCQRVKHASSGCKLDSLGKFPSIVRMVAGPVSSCVDCSLAINIVSGGLQRHSQSDLYRRFPKHVMVLIVWEQLRGQPKAELRGRPCATPMHFV